MLSAEATAQQNIRNTILEIMQQQHPKEFAELSKEIGLIQETINRLGAFAPDGKLRHPNLFENYSPLSCGENLEFIKNFEDVSDNVLSLLNKDAALIDEWKALATAAERGKFVEALKEFTNGKDLFSLSYTKALPSLDNDWAETLKTLKKQSYYELCKQVYGAYETTAKSINQNPSPKNHLWDGACKN